MFQLSLVPIELFATHPVVSIPDRGAKAFLTNSPVDRLAGTSCPCTRRYTCNDYRRLPVRPFTSGSLFRFRTGEPKLFSQPLPLTDSQAPHALADSAVRAVAAEQRLPMRACG